MSFGGENNSILYYRCVEGKADGLREGDECTDEAEAYKRCRQLVREARLMLRDGADTQKPR